MIKWNKLDKTKTNKPELGKNNELEGELKEKAQEPGINVDTHLFAHSGIPFNLNLKL